MAQQHRFTHMKSFGGHGLTPAVVSLLALVVCFQIAQVILVGRRLGEDMPGDSWGSCNSAAESLYCAEARLFHSWQLSHADDIVDNVTEHELLQQHVEASWPGTERAHPLGTALVWNATVRLLDETAGGNATHIASTTTAAKSPEAPEIGQQGLVDDEEPTEDSDVDDEEEGSVDDSDHEAEERQLKIDAMKSELQSLLANVNPQRYDAKVSLALSSNVTAVLPPKPKESENHTALAQAVFSEIESVVKGLCSDPLRRDHKACANRSLAGASTQPPSLAPASSTSAPAAKAVETRSAGLRGAARSPQIYDNPALRWSVVQTWENAPQSNESVEASSAAVADKRWMGHIPSVSCITVVPSTPNAMAYLQFFLSSFIGQWARQHYEGERQLVFVYEYNNTHAHRMLQEVADGSNIVAAGARREGNLTSFPSAEAYRYGMWVASQHGMDVIARWDFDAWHHPARLATQVKAMALMERPACTLKRWTKLKDDGEEDASDPEAPRHSIKSGGRGMYASLVGELNWMKKHWRPAMEEPSTEEPTTGYEVTVDAPDMLVHNPDLSLHVG